ncbi:MAG: pyrroline-5-carboxylate reductase dimerization domain-containing protein [Patescibacteria group bacterium]
MKKRDCSIGFIGFGRMGSILGSALVESGCARPGEIVVFEKDRRKRRILKQFALADSAQEVVDRAKVIFVCVRPLEVREVAKSIVIKKNTIIISIAAGVNLAMLQRMFGRSVMRVIPSYTQKALSGVLLYCHAKGLSRQSVGEILKLLKCIGEPIQVPEKLLEIATDLSSCSPAFWAFMADTFVREATRLGLSNVLAQRITTMAMLGTSKILVQESHLERVIDHVATPGGITREGIEALEKEFPHTVKEIFRVTGKKYALLRKRIERL